METVLKIKKTTKMNTPGLALEINKSYVERRKDGNAKSV